jgi:hypothetical protein
VDGVAAGRGAVVDGRRDDVHLEQVAHHALVLEDGQEAAVVVDLDAAVSRQEFRAAHNLGDERRGVVRPAAGAQEAEQLVGAAILRQDRSQLAGDVRLGARLRLEVQPAREPERRGDLLVDLVDRRDADLREHPLADAGRGVGDVAVDEPSAHFASSSSPHPSQKCLISCQASADVASP